jgi:hypothetical protein
VLWARFRKPQRRRLLPLTFANKYSLPPLHAMRASPHGHPRASHSKVFCSESACFFFLAVHDVRWDSTWLEIVECGSIGPCRINLNAVEKSYFCYVLYSTAHTSIFRLVKLPCIEGNRTYRKKIKYTILADALRAGQLGLCTCTITIRGSRLFIFLFGLQASGLQASGLRLRAFLRLLFVIKV